MAADGSQQKNISQNPRSDYSPAWSPDGTTIAFASDRDGDPNEIYLMDADGSRQVRVTDNPGIDDTRHGRLTASRSRSTARWVASTRTGRVTSRFAWSTETAPASTG